MISRLPARGERKEANLPATPVEPIAPVETTSSPIETTPALALTAAGIAKPLSETHGGQGMSGKGADALLEAGGAGGSSSTAAVHSGDEALMEGAFGEIDAPAFIHREMPSYPRSAQRLGKEGRVVLKLRIDKQGKLQQVDVLESSWQGFTEAALEAVRKSSFSPGRRNGQIVSSIATLCIRFRLK
jgi:protein TonB